MSLDLDAHVDLDTPLYGLDGEQITDVRPRTIAVRQRDPLAATPLTTFWARVHDDRPNAPPHFTG